MKRFFITLVFCALVTSSFGQYSFGVKYSPSAKMNSESTPVYSFDFGYTNRLSDSSAFSSETLFGFDYYNHQIKSGNFNVLLFIPYAYSLRDKSDMTVSPGISMGVVFDGAPNYTFVTAPQLSLIIPVNKAEYYESHQYFNLKVGYEISTNTSLLDKGLFLRLGMDFW